MKGFDLKKIHAVVVDCFKTDEFEQLLKFDFDVDVGAEVGNVGFKKAAFVITEKADDEGWLPELVAAVARERPKRPDVQKVYREYAAALVSATRQAEVDAAVAEAHAKFFGAAPPVEIQRAGVGEAVVPTADVGLERTIRDGLGYVDAATWVTALLGHAGRVCRVELNDASGTMGTGFLVGPDALLTNYHVLQKVIDGPHPAAAVKFRFDYKTLPGGAPADGVLAGFTAADDAARTWLLGHGPYSAAEKAGTPDVAPPGDGELDYALVRLDRTVGSEPGAGGTPRGWVPLPTAAPALPGLPCVMILQHPKTLPLKLAFDTTPGAELKHGGRRLRYTTNTEGGSSGSPVFDKDWKLVALHHYGDPAFAHPKYNQGVPVHLIREHLSAAARAALGGAPA